VVPQAFGRFRDNLTLKCVCDGCNSYFGQKLELTLGRGSGEAVSRLHHGVKPPHEAGDLDLSRIVMRVSEPGPACGAWATLSANAATKELEGLPLPQAGFRKKDTSDWVWLKEDDLELEDAVAPFRVDVEIRILGRTQEDIDRVSEKVRKAGVAFREQGKIQQEPAASEMHLACRAEIDMCIRRAIAKIGFNYLAYCEGALFARRAEFDEVREFVRLGKEFDQEPVIASNRAILADDSPAWRGTTGHLLTLCWAAGGNALVASVSLFNSMTYDVFLCRRYGGVWHDVKHGHHFDIRTKQVSALKSVSRLLL